MVSGQVAVSGSSDNKHVENKKPKDKQKTMDGVSITERVHGLLFTGNKGAAYTHLSHAARSSSPCSFTNGFKRFVKRVWDPSNIHANALLLLCSTNIRTATFLRAAKISSTSITPERSTSSIFWPHIGFVFVQGRE